MGCVYQARDTRLGRDVAIKSARAEFSRRFQREAQAISALNHPNVCTLYDVGPDYLVMELIEGPTLAERMAKGAIPLSEALDIARQVAEAMEAAHEKGIVHRDLKPGNIKLTGPASGRPGTVKVLDLGLARDLTPAGSAQDSPTLTASAETGMIVGTAAYMSPEQARGEVVDKRADIWSFGVVLWEMLTGRRLFEAPTVTETLAGVLTGPIDFGLLPGDTPPVIRSLLRRCLDRDPKNRLRDIGEARVAIDTADQPDQSARPAPHSRSSFAWIAAAAVLAVSLAAMSLLHFRETPPERRRLRFQINPPEENLLFLDLSPDGRLLYLHTITAVDRTKAWLRPLDGLDTRLLQDFRGRLVLDSPLFWSPDGKHLGYVAEGKLYQMPLDSGPTTVLRSAPADTEGGAWLNGGVILYETASGLFRASLSGGEPVKIDDRRMTHAMRLPGRRFLFSCADGIFAGSLDGGKPVQVLPDRSAAIYVPPATRGLRGHLLFVRNQTLFAQLFDAERFKLEGEPIAVAEHVGMFAASENGVLAFRRPPSRLVQLTWLDRAGKVLRTTGDPFVPMGNSAIRLSPDDSRAIVTIQGADGVNLWIADLNRGTRSRFTFNKSNSGIWSPDGRRVLWAALDGKKYVKPADGSGQDEFVFQSSCNLCFVGDWSSDGRFVLFSDQIKEGRPESWLLPLQGDRKPFLYQSGVTWPKISPDNRWMAHVAGENVQPQVFIDSIPYGKGHWQVSTDGGDWPIWRRDGKELFYRQDTKLMAVPVTLGATTVEVGKPQPLFDVPMFTRFQVSRDGQRFLIAMPLETAPTPITVDTDWRAALTK
jgi:Tol biopolymer transport system component/tRNA A-37 threonylcarbamoyl transferase component Bud32